MAQGILSVASLESTTYTFYKLRNCSGTMRIFRFRAFGLASPFTGSYLPPLNPHLLGCITMQEEASSMAESQIFPTAPQQSHRGCEEQPRIARYAGR